MRKITVVIALSLLAGCTSTGQLTPTAAADLAAACKADQTLQPVAAASAAAAGPGGVAGAAVDTTVVHPLVVAGCAAAAASVAPAPATTP